MTTITICITVLLLGLAYLYVRSRENRGRSIAENAHCNILREIGDALENATAYAEARAPGPLLVGKTVVVHTRKPDDQSVQGVVVGDYPDKVVLRDAVYFRSGGGVQEAGGAIEVLRHHISTVQVPVRQQQEA